jgi:hypothetical protein
MNTQIIDMISMADFLGHEPRLCEVCEHRQAAVFMLARNDERTAKAHVCLTCFELAESTDCNAIIESVYLQEFNEILQDTPAM